MAKTDRQKLTDAKKKRIIADYIETGNYSATARKFGVSMNTVKRLYLRNPELADKVKQKKEQNTADIFAFMEKRKDQVCDMIDIYMAALTDKEKLEKATVNQLSTALGTVIDKFTMSSRMQSDVVRDIEDLTPLSELLTDDYKEPED